MNKRTLSIVLLVLATSLSFGQVWPHRWFWRVYGNGPGANGDQMLTNNCGAKAELLRNYDENKTWVSTGFTVPYQGTYTHLASEYDDFGLEYFLGYATVRDDGNVPSGNVCMASTNNMKFAAWGRGIPPGDVVVATQDLTTHEDYWDLTALTETNYYDFRHQVAIDAKTNDGVSYVNVAYLDSSYWEYGYNVRLMVAVSSDNGSSWDQQELASWTVPSADPFKVHNPVVAMDQYSSSGKVWLGVIGYDDEIMYWTSTDNGVNWSNDNTVYAGADEFSAAVRGSLIFVCWNELGDMYYVWSADGGDNWIWDDDDPWEFPSLPEGEYAAPNVEFLLTDTDTRLIVAHEYWDGIVSNPTSYVAEFSGRYNQGNPPWWQWFRWNGLSWTPADEPDDRWNPSLRLIWTDLGPRGCCVWSDARFSPRRSYVAFGDWREDYSIAIPPAQADNVGRNLLVDPDGVSQYAGYQRPYVVSGHISGESSRPVIVHSGTYSALALDGAGNRWVACTDADTVWVMLGDGSYKAVFAGDSSAVPGQPSIFCTEDGATQQAHIVFAVYGASSSMVAYAKLDLTHLAFDTIATSNTLSESLPCVNVYADSGIFVTWQDGNSVKAALLTYTPGSWDPPGSWTTSTVGDSGAYHPMSALQGDSLHIIWARDISDTFSIRSQTCLASGGALDGWGSTTEQSEEHVNEKTNPVAAGSGVSVWQEMVGGKWTIRGSVRGDTVTMVSTDSGSYHPHAVAESLGTGPSVNTVSVKLLWTEGVIFEVDSGVYDTGVTKYAVKDYAVSSASTAATERNNGTKLLNKAGTDSLLAVYEDTDGSVVYAQSADGDSWQREVMVEDRDWPAIAEDSSGKRWVVVHRVNELFANQNQEAYYRNGSSWTGPQTLYTSQQYGTLGPASLAGASDTSSGIAYAAFLAPVGLLKAVVLTKFNGSVMAACTVVTGMSLGDPTLAVEPYLQDSDHVHLSWADNGVVKYCMDTDGRSQAIASNWTSTVTLSNAMVTSSHPCIGADRDQIVVAWAQGATAEIYSRKRSTGSAYNNWESEVNLSNTNTASDYPTIAMGDTVIVAWEEQRTVSDHDVLVSVNFGDTLNIADNATKSSYPHIVFQKSDTIPYIHTIWTDEPQSGYFEVRCNKLNLKQSGEGQQSAGKIPIPIKPALNACRPNPFRDRTQISYQLPSAGSVSLRIYDVTGRTVRTLANGFQKPGAYSVSWDSKDNRGHLVPHGVYFYRLDTKGFRDVKKAVVTR